MPTINPNLARARRVALRLSQREVAHRAHISLTTYSRIERTEGYAMRAQTAEAIANALFTSLDSLRSGTELRLFRYLYIRSVDSLDKLATPGSGLLSVGQTMTNKQVRTHVEAILKHSIKDSRYWEYSLDGAFVCEVQVSPVQIRRLNELPSVSIHVQPHHEVTLELLLQQLNRGLSKSSEGIPALGLNAWMQIAEKFIWLRNGCPLCKRAWKETSPADFANTQSARTMFEGLRLD